MDHDLAPIRSLAETFTLAPGQLVALSTYRTLDRNPSSRASIGIESEALADPG